MAEPNVTMTTVSNRPMDQYTNAVEYIQDLVPGSLPRSIHDAFRNTTELYYHLPPAMLNATPARKLEFTAGIRPNDHTSFSTKQLWENIGSILVYITGVEMTERCEHLPSRNRCTKKYPRTVVPDPSLDYGPKFQGNKRKACAGHQYDAEWSRCKPWGDMILPGGQQAPVSQPFASQPVAAAAEGSASPSGASQPSESLPVDTSNSFIQTHAAASLTTDPRNIGLQTYGFQALPYQASSYQVPYYPDALSNQYVIPQGDFPQAHTTQPQSWSTPWPHVQVPQLPNECHEAIDDGFKPLAAWDLEQGSDLNETIAGDVNSTSCSARGQNAAAFQHDFCHPALWQPSTTQQDHFSHTESLDQKAVDPALVVFATSPSQQQSSIPHELPAAMPEELQDNQLFDTNTDVVHNLEEVELEEAKGLSQKKNQIENP